MRRLWLMACLLPVADPLGAASIESLRAAAELDFFRPPAPASVAAEVPAPSQRPAIRWSEPVPAMEEAVGPLVGSFILKDRLDLQRRLMTKRLGALDWEIGMASDPRFKIAYMTFSRGDQPAIRRIESMDRLRGEGVVLSIDPQTSYRFKVQINIFDPVRGSTFRMEPAGGTRGPTHQMSTGQLLDLVKAKSFVFQAAGREYLLQYGTDVDPATDQLAATRSLLILHEEGLGSKAWPVPEASLQPDAPKAVSLDGTWVTLLRTSDGWLRIHEGGAATSAR